jgi:hypothetical protein
MSASEIVPPASRVRAAFGVRAAIALSAFVALQAMRASAADDLTLWAHWTDLYFDTSPNGANVTGTVREFPVLVRLRAANFDFAQAMGKGQDLRFAKPNGTALVHEIERWDSTGRIADIWVRADTVKGNYQGVFARMYWGKSGSPSNSDPNGVFNADNDFESVWHMGGAVSALRPNAVAGKSAATAVNFDGDESREGMIGWADSLDGGTTGNSTGQTGTPGDNLLIGDGYTNLTPGMTLSVWAYPTRKTYWGRLFELGNGSGQDNINLARKYNSQDLMFSLWQSGLKVAEITATGVLFPDQWSLFTVTVLGKAAKIYRNGVLVASDNLAAGVTSTRRASNYLGRSSWSGDEYFAGKLDEPIIADVARSPDWIKLAYANQNPKQNLVLFTPPPALCASQEFSVPADTSLPEGSSVELAAVADCAASFLWSALAGPAPRILDPEVKVLQVSLPRVGRDTSILYRFTADFGQSAKTKDVQIRVKESIPDPVFAMPSLTWNGRDSLLLKPVVSNLAEIKASPEPNLFYAWSLTASAGGSPADTAWSKDGLLLKSTPKDGILKVGLCLHNNGAVACNASTITVQHATALAAPTAPEMEAPGAKPGRDAKGRWTRKLKSRRASPGDRAF